MRNPLRSTLGQTIALQYLALGLGVAWWRIARGVDHSARVTVFGFGSLGWGDLLTTWLPLAGLAIIALVVAAYQVHRQRPGDRATLALTIGLAAYATAVVLCEPFMLVAGGEPTGGLIAVAIVLLPFLSFQHLVEKRQWLTITALILFLATCIALMLFNAGLFWGGVGFLPGPRECR